ncbi:MAG: hypothetical protein J5621_09400 [Paludibacteraceae bacterium]|nr:hypothetical protein [Paludibacteraceae bacterium]
MKRIYFILVAMIATLFVACEGYNPELKNQPLTKSGKINKYWTPAGHTYFCAESDNYFIVYRFFEENGECISERYGTTNSDMSESGEEVSPYSLSGEYPNFTITSLHTFNSHTCTFTDTLTFTRDGQTYKLYR